MGFKNQIHLSHPCPLCGMVLLFASPWGQGRKRLFLPMQLNQWSRPIIEAVTSVQADSLTASAGAARARGKSVPFSLQSEELPAKRHQDLAFDVCLPCKAGVIASLATQNITKSTFSSGHNRMFIAGATETGRHTLCLGLCNGCGHMVGI